LNRVESGQSIPCQVIQRERRGKTTSMEKKEDATGRKERSAEKKKEKNITLGGGGEKGPFSRGN